MNDPVYDLETALDAYRAGQPLEKSCFHGGATEPPGTDESDLTVIAYDLTHLLVTGPETDAQIISRAQWAAALEKKDYSGVPEWWEELRLEARDETHAREMAQTVCRFESYEHWGRHVAEESGYLAELSDSPAGHNPLSDYVDFEGFARAVEDEGLHVVIESGRDIYVFDYET